MFIRDLSQLSDDDNFNLIGFDVVRVDHPSNTKIQKKVVPASTSKSPFQKLSLKILDNRFSIFARMYLLADKTYNFALKLMVLSLNLNWSN